MKILQQKNYIISYIFHWLDLSMTVMIVLGSILALFHIN